MDSSNESNDFVKLVNNLIDIISAGKRMQSRAAAQMPAALFQRYPWALATDNIFREKQQTMLDLVILGLPAAQSGQPFSMQCNGWINL
jgi:hypothetical protein